MKIKLSVIERLSLLQILPKMNNVITMKIIRDLNERLGIGAREAKEIELSFYGENVKWNIEKDKNVEFEFNDIELGIIKDSLKELDKQKKIEVRHISLFEKFIQ